uniref:CSON010454 protein n=1 Tax=Culicoides sonorensis TaxID=179676 RepID=A0A336LEX5_CULSO
MEEPGTVRLTNDDFRKLLMTPRAPPPGSTPAVTSGVSGAIKSTKSSSAKKSERHDARKKKKNFYAQLKKSEDNKLQELSEKYRDRARERRDGANPDYQAPDPTSTGAYRAVAPDLKSINDAAERRRQLIQESKFLGGDMEHTHLVKGLDYALLQKVKSEIMSKEQMEEEEMERLANEKKDEEPEKEQVEVEENGEIKFKTIIGKNIHRFIQYQRSRIIERNELFAPGRMAYSIELDDENTDTDIPTTIIRSKAEIPQEQQETQTLSTNDIVINKLSQILSYLRQGGKGKKNKKRDKDKPLFKMPLDKHNDDESIYGDIGDYKASRNQSSSSSRYSSSRSDKQDKQPRNYFGSYRDEEREKEKEEITIPPPPKIATSSILNKLAAEPEGYAECYPGLQEMNDAIDDSDDEVDYTKMDIGNKKGPIGRWDFDTQEEYSDYMSKKEALPKAAFQYGVKMQDGRKTRKHKTEKSEKAELDREWQKIQNIIQKRKAGGSAGGEPSSKKHY